MVLLLGTRERPGKSADTATTPHGAEGITSRKENQAHLTLGSAKRHTIGQPVETIEEEYWSNPGCADARADKQCVNYMGLCF